MPPPPALIPAVVGPPGAVKAIVARGRVKLLEVESPYNYIQIQERVVPQADGRERRRRLLVLNEGFAVHSVYDPEGPMHPYVGSVWDYFGLCALPLAGCGEGARADVCIVGLAAGTISKEMFATYGDVMDLHVDGVEIDPTIIELGRDYFGMDEPGLHAVAEDGRTFLQRTSTRYDVIITDAYKQPYIPFHLTTDEYFAAKRAHLKDNGVVAINVGTLSAQSELFRRIVTTIRGRFPYVYYIPVSFPGALFTNFVVVGSLRALDPTVRLNPAQNPILGRLEGRSNWVVARDVLRRARNNWTTFVPVAGVDPLTDDKAPVEFLTDWQIVSYLLSGKAQEAMASELGHRSGSSGGGGLDEP